MVHNRMLTCESGITLPKIGEHATKEKVINLSKNAEKQDQYDNNNDNENQSKDKDMTQSDFSGTIEKVGRDLQILNEIGVDHVVFSYHFLPQGEDMEEIINISKELALYAK
jgi:hypothetical protein